LASLGASKDVESFLDNTKLLEVFSEMFYMWDPRRGIASVYHREEKVPHIRLIYSAGNLLEVAIIINEDVTLDDVKKSWKEIKSYQKSSKHTSWNYGKTIYQILFQY